MEALAGITASWSTPPVSASKEEPKVFLLPTRNKDCDRVIQYLFGRGIDLQIIQEYITDGTIYESARYVLQLLHLTSAVLNMVLIGIMLLILSLRLLQ